MSQFGGAIPQSVKNSLGEQLKLWREQGVGDLYVACSGNFTVERLAANYGFRCHSNDVLLYTTALGWLQTGEAQKWDLNEEYVEEFGWLKEWLVGDDVRKVATLMTAGHLVAAMGKADNPYYARLATAARESWPRLHAETEKRIKDARVDLLSYAPEDCFTWVQGIPKDAAVLAYPPFENLSDVYARNFDKLERLFLWDTPQYEFLDEKRLTEFLAMVRDRKHWTFATNWPVPDVEPRGVFKTTNRAPTVRVYGSDAPLRLQVPHQAVENVNVPRLGPHEDVGEDIRLVMLSYSQFQTLRSQYMNPGIRPGAASLSVGVLVDDKLVGVFAFQTSRSPAHYAWMLPQPKTYLLSDFPVAPSKHGRLAKLVLYAALSHEAKTLVERYSNRRWRSVSTTALSKNPVSMKYRGLFQLVERKEFHLEEASWNTEIEHSNPYYDRPWELQYGSPLGRWSLKEGLEEWRQKHSK